MLAGVQLTPEDMRRAAMACRAAAFTAEQDGEKQTNPSVKEQFAEEAEKYRALALRFDAGGMPRFIRHRAS